MSPSRSQRWLDLLSVPAPSQALVSHTPRIVRWIRERGLDGSEHREDGTARVYQQVTDRFRSETATAGDNPMTEESDSAPGPELGPSSEAVPPTGQEVFYYRHGVAVLHTVREAPPPWMDFDPRLEGHVAPGHRYPELRSWARVHGVRERADPDPGLDGTFDDTRTPRPYQKEALERWTAAGGRGSVVLPTGAGKTLVALMAIRQTGGGACVVAPTRALVSQWFNQLADAFGVAQVGAYYGDEKEVRTLTVTTYHSAFSLLERWGRRFELLVLDEVHHLADGAGDGSKGWHDALRIAPARHVLGLTATYPDGRDRAVQQLAGPVSYRRRLGEMLDAELADLAVERRFVGLNPSERARYDAAEALYVGFVEARSYRERFGEAASEWWPVFMADTRRSPAARRALRAFRERERIVALAEGKLVLARRILGLHPAEQAILFCGTTEAAQELSLRFAVPLIRAETPASERKRVLDLLASGEVRAVASVEVLDEGWDVPGAKLGIVLGSSRSGGRRQHQQRLGRILRRQGDQVASLFELVAADTHEFFASQRRGGGLRSVTDRQLGLGF
jgi:superfamily II DNA or RNA helicase